MRRSSGFTLIELMVYMSLVTMGLMACGGIELQAQKAVAVQAALVDIDRQATGYLGQLRRDVEDSRKLEVQGNAESKGSDLIVHDRDGGAVIYRAGERVVLFPSGKQRAREPFRLLKTLTVVIAKEPSRVAVVATFKGGEIERTFHRVAAPRQEVSR
jgi:type II secretory pathway pseudopilin PulG